MLKKAGGLLDMMFSSLFTRRFSILLSFALYSAHPILSTDFRAGLNWQLAASENDPAC
jgi:hypothetical protein